MAESSYTELKEDVIVIGERLYEAALNLVIGRAEQELLIFDADLGKGDYASLQRFNLLSSFLASNPAARLTLILQNAELMPERCPRLFGLLGRYGHAMTVYQTSEQAQVAKDCFVIADQKHYLRRFHVDQPRFRYAFEDMETVTMLNMRFDELLQLTSHRLAATSLGL